MKMKNNENEDCCQNYQKHKKLITFDEQKCKEYCENKIGNVVENVGQNLEIKIGKSFREKSSQRLLDKKMESKRKREQMIKTNVEIVSNQGSRSMK